MVQQSSGTLKGVVRTLGLGALAIGMAFVLNACGGGGGDDDDTATPAGVWGTDSLIGSYVLGTVETSGRSWFVYLDNLASGVFDGVVIGSIAGSNGVITQGSTRDLAFGSSAAPYEGDLTGTYKLKNYLNLTFRASRVNRAELKFLSSVYPRARLDTVAGSYSGYVYSAGSSTATTRSTWTVHQDGTITGSIGSSCSVAGSISAQDGYYGVAITYGAGCSLAGKTYEGSGFYEPESEGLIAFVSNADQTHGNLFAVGRL